MSKLAAILASAFYDKGKDNSGCSCLGGIVVVLALVVLIFWLIEDIPKTWELSNYADSSDFSSIYYEQKANIILLYYIIFFMFPFVGWRMTRINAKKKPSTEFSRFLDNLAYAHLCCILPGGIIIILLRLFLPWWSFFFVIIPILSAPIIIAIRRNIKNNKHRLK